MGVYGMFNSMIISGKKEFRPNLDINLSCLNVRVFVSHQKSKLFVIVNYGWILDFEVSNGQPFRPKFSVTDFLPNLRIIFVSKLYLIYSILNLVSFILYSCIVYLACCIIYPLSFIMYYKSCILHPVPLIQYNISWN